MSEAFDLRGPEEDDGGLKPVDTFIEEGILNPEHALDGGDDESGGESRGIDPRILDDEGVEGLEEFE